ncbi:MAG: hypothetical protein QME05_06900 [Candidatus Margulisbacteria bacterium]|nr:hypothetical protein [Candidatus Margulisiibacteriota bacterium]
MNTTPPRRKPPEGWPSYLRLIPSPPPKAPKPTTPEELLHLVAEEVIAKMRIFNGPSEQSAISALTARYQRQIEFFNATAIAPNFDLLRLGESIEPDKPLHIMALTACADTNYLLWFGLPSSLSLQGDRALYFFKITIDSEITTAFLPHVGALTGPIACGKGICFDAAVSDQEDLGITLAAAVCWQIEVEFIYHFCLNLAKGLRDIHAQFPLPNTVPVFSPPSRPTSLVPFPAAGPIPPPSFDNGEETSPAKTVEKEVILPQIKPVRFIDNFLALFRRFLLRLKFLLHLND